MKCQKCGIELSPGIEEQMGLCPDCSFKNAIHNKKIENENNTSGQFKPQYWIGGLLSILAWITLVCGVSFTLIIAGRVGLFLTILYLFSTFCAFGFWMGFAEIIRMLQNIFGRQSVEDKT